MPLSFHELILDEQYSPAPRGGPEFAHNVVSVPASGVEDITRLRPTALHRYIIDWSQLVAERRSRLYSFFLAVGGVGGAFRLLAPEPHNQFLENEAMSGSGTIWKLQKTHSFTADSFYGGATSTYTQRIVKPVYNELTITVSGVPISLTADGTMNWTTGTFTFNSTPGATPRATGRYHLPVRFTRDWLEMAHDVSSDWQGVELVEVLPKSLGIT